METLYRNKSSLEAIFRIIDKDNSGKYSPERKDQSADYLYQGYISLDELAEACNLIKEHMPCNMTEDQLQEICRMMDFNKDGLVDLNEFLETFRMVDPESKTKNMPTSPENSNLASANRSPKPLKTLKSTESRQQSQDTADLEKSNIFVEAANSLEVPEIGTSNNETPAQGGDNFSLKVQIHNCNGSSPEGSDNDGSLMPMQRNGLKTSPVLSSRRGSQI